MAFSSLGVDCTHYIFTFLFLIVLLLTDSDAYAYKEISNSKSVKGYSKEIFYVTEWFLKNDYGKKEISNPREMYSPDGEFVALCFDLNNSGYAKNVDLQEYLCNNKYLFNCGMNSNEVANGGTRLRINLFL